MDDLNAVLRERLQKAEQMETDGVPLYPNGFSAPDPIDGIISGFGMKSATELEAAPHAFVVAGRIMALRSFGRSIFMHIQDPGGRLQIYVQQNQVSKECFSVVKRLDVGDIIRASGSLFRTKTDELTLLARELTLVTKSLRPLPEKYHGLKDIEIRLRQRYVDLIVHDSVREV